MKVFLSSIILLIVSVTAEAQNITNAAIQWNISQVFDAITGDVEIASQKIIIDRTSTIQWISEHGVVKYTFIIQSYSGNWSNVKTPGSITYQIKEGNSEGKLMINRNADKIIIRINLFKDSDLLIYELTATDSQSL